MSCREDIFNTLTDITDPRAVWNALKDRFEKVNNASCLMLLDKLNSVRLLDGGSVQEYLKKLQEIRMHLKRVGHTISETTWLEEWWEHYLVLTKESTIKSAA